MKPNILFVMSDEHPPFLAGCYGHRVVKTPAMDSLAQRGTIFDAAYCASPICAPCRAAMMTGRRVSTIEVWDNASPLRSDWPTFAHSFRAGGYRTILCGKMHFVGPDQYHGFDERWTQDIYPADFRWTRPNRAGVPYNDGQNIVEGPMKAGVGWVDDNDYDEEVSFRTQNGLRQLAKNPDQPFMLIASFTNPHPPYRAPKKYWDMYRDEDVDLPKIPPDYLEREHPYIKGVRFHGGYDHLLPDDICRAARRAYYGRTTMFDDYLQQILSLLKELDLEKNTIVVYSSDHGDMLGEHGLWFKNTSYEWSSRVPLIVAGPGIKTRRCAEPVSLLDIGPTFCSLAGIDPIYPVTDGRDIADLLHGRRPDGPGLAMMENYGEGMWRGVRMVRRGNYKLTIDPTHEPELFDLSRDPGEWNNLASSPAHRAIRDELVAIARKDWDPDRLDEARYQSEERRAAILKAMAGESFGWQFRSPPPAQPLGFE
jgi:choline-sulfatase